MVGLGIHRHLLRPGGGGEDKAVATDRLRVTLIRGSWSLRLCFSDRITLTLSLFSMKADKYLAARLSVY